jgi:hypothetical protein
MTDLVVDDFPAHSPSTLIAGMTPERLKQMLAHLTLKNDDAAVSEAEPATAKPAGGFSALDFDRHLRSVPDEVYEKLAPLPLIPATDFATATGCEHMLKLGYKRTFTMLFPFGEIKVVRDRWQIAVRSSAWPERTLAPSVIIRDLTKEAGFAHLGIVPVLSSADDLRYAFDRAFAGVRVVDLYGMFAPSAKDICERLSWRSQFKLNSKNRIFATLTLSSLIDMNPEGFLLADGKVVFEPTPDTLSKSAPQKRYVVGLTLGRRIDGFKAPLIGHGWSCMADHERPSHLQGVTFNASLKEVPGSSDAAH